MPVAADSDRVALVPRRLARHRGPSLGLQVVDLPLDLPAAPIAVQRHARVDADPAPLWLRAVLRQAADDSD